MSAIQTILADLGLIEPATCVRMASDGATLVIGQDEMRVIDRSRETGQPRPIDTYRISLGDGVTALTLTRGEDAPAIELATYRGRRGVTLARRSLAELAVSRIGTTGQGQGYPWFKTLAVLAVLWIGFRVIASSVAVPVSLPAQAAVIPAPAAPSTVGAPSPTGNVSLPALPSGPVTCGNLE